MAYGILFSAYEIAYRVRILVRKRMLPLNILPFESASLLFRDPL